MPYTDIKTDLILNEISEEDLHSQESLPPNQYWMTDEFLDNINAVTTDTEQEIFAKKIFKSFVQFMSTLLDEKGNVLLGSSGVLLQLGNIAKSLQIMSSGRPNVNDGTFQQMAYLSDIPAETIAEYSLGQKGYIKLKNGLMIQWLNANHSNAGTHSWSLPFTSATSYCMATSTLGASSSATATVSIRNQAYSKTNTGFSAYNTAFASGGCDYIAIGY